MAKEQKVDCPQCQGKGRKKYPNKKYEETCAYCAGSGKVVVYR